MKLGTLKEDKDALCKGEELHEVAAFAADNDSLELRSLKRSGETKIPEVQAARDAFFGQDTYKYRGCESCAAFDGREEPLPPEWPLHWGSRETWACPAFSH